MAPSTTVSTVGATVSHDQEKPLLRELAQAAQEYRGPDGAVDGLRLASDQMKLRLAFVRVLRPDGPFAQAFAEAMTRLYQGDATPEEMRAASGNLMERRAEDQAAWAALLGRDTLWDAFLREAARPAPEEAPGMTDAKRAALKARIAYQPEGSRSEALFHTIGNEDGQRRLHRNLAQCWDPSGPLRPLLLQELQKALQLPEVRAGGPDVPLPHVEAAAARFLAARQRAALLEVDALAPGGPLRQEIAREASRDAPSPGR